MTRWQERLTSNKAVAVGLAVFLVVVILGALLFVTPKLSGAPAAAPCEELQQGEIARSENLVRTNLSGSITAAEFELAGVQSQLRESEAGLTTKRAELDGIEAVLTEEEAARKTDQDELTAREGAREEALSELTERQADVRVAAEAGEDQTQIDALNDEISLLQQRADSLETRIATLRDRITALNDSIGANNAKIGSLEQVIGVVTTTIDSLLRTEATLKVRLEAKNLARSAMLSPSERDEESTEARERLATKRAELLVAQDAAAVQPPIVALTDDIAALELAIAALDDPRWALAAESGLDSTSAYLPARVEANLVPAVPVSRIELGSRRTPSRVEIVLERARFGGADGSAASADEGGSASALSEELPDKATYAAEAGQFRRGSGPAIPAEQISVWARRVGTVVILSVCITPGGVDPGLYSGDVYLVDPSLNPTRARVEIAAQSVWINDLYWLVILLPLLALVYLWITARHSAGESPWEMAPLKRWLTKNSVGALVVGIAAVWATLQVPLNNPTWGSSWVNAAAVVGVGLVAAVTAMTVVAGKIRGDGIDDAGDGADDAPKVEDVQI